MIEGLVFGVGTPCSVGFQGNSKPIAKTTMLVVPYFKAHPFLGLVSVWFTTAQQGVSPQNETYPYEQRSILISAIST